MSADDARLFLTNSQRDADLEGNTNTTADQCLERFLAKGGTFQYISDFSTTSKSVILISPGDAVYPICSGGYCRSQTLWALLHPFQDHITLFAPHSARYGWDPYNGRINRCRNEDRENLPDAFAHFFGIEKSLRFGFEHAGTWAKIEKSPTADALHHIFSYYNDHYFGPQTLPSNGKRLYIAFGKNAHVTLHRLNQANSTLAEVSVIAIELEDLATNPPEALQTTSRSIAAYSHLATLIKATLDLTPLTEEIDNYATSTTAS